MIADAGSTLEVHGGSASSVTVNGTAQFITKSLSAATSVANGGRLMLESNVFLEFRDSDMATFLSATTFSPGSTLAIGLPHGGFSYRANLSGPFTLETLSDNLSLTLFGINSYTGGTNVTHGKLEATNGDAFGDGALSVSDGAVAFAPTGLSKALTITTLTTSGTGALDLNCPMVMRNMTAAQVQALILSGFNGGAWNGPGIRSSAAAADANATGTKAIGWANNAEYGLTDWYGVSGLTANDVLVRYTYYGDADLNGEVTLDDFNQWLFVFQSNGGPLGQLQSAINSAPALSGAQRAMMLAAVAAVPEPAMTGALGLMMGAFSLSRRRRCA